MDAMVLLLLLLAVPAASAQLPRLSVGEDHPITGGGNNYTEVHLVIHPADPRHMVVAAMKETTPPPDLSATAGRHITELLLSRDGGLRWDAGTPDSDLWQQVQLASDPWLAFGLEDALYYAVLPRIVDQEGRGRRGIHVYRSVDGGRSWHQSTNVPLGDGGSYDKTSITVDTTAGPLAGTVYVLAAQAWTASNGDGRDGPVVARSDDEGRSFTVPLRFGPNNLRHGISHPPVVLSDGRLVIAFYDFFVPATKTFLQHPRLWVLTSSDGGETVSGPYLVAESVEAIPPFLTSDRSSVNRDRLFLAWTGQKEDRNIYVSRSDDRGQTWSVHVRVNSSIDTHDRRYKPMLVMNSQGFLGAAWRDSRDDPADKCTHIYFSASLDGGLTFLPDVRVSAEPTCADSWWGADGEYFGLDTTASEFRLVWADNRSGSYELVLNTVTIEN